MDGHNSSRPPSAEKDESLENQLRRANVRLVNAEETAFSEGIDHESSDDESSDDESSDDESLESQARRANGRLADARERLHRAAEDDESLDSQALDNIRLAHIKQCIWVRDESGEDEPRSYLRRVEAKKRMHWAPESFINPEYWSKAAQVESIILEMTEIGRKISLRDFKGPESEWQKTDQAKALFEKTRAQELALRMCHQQREELSERKPTPQDGIGASLMKLFTSQPTPLLTYLGAGRRDERLQAVFRTEVIKAYGAKHEKRDWLWCPILGEWGMAESTITPQLFPSMHGQDNMDAIFGCITPSDLTNPKNGLVVSSALQEYFDSGKLAIVPDLPERSKAADLLAWIRGESREYKVKILDKSWEVLNHEVSPHNEELTYGMLDNRRLKFLTDFRPADKYLYFHYCVQVLRCAWQNRGQTSDVLKDELGKSFWGTSGQYLPKNMLLALVKELEEHGHNYRELLDGASCSQGEDSLLLKVAINQVKSRPSGFVDYLETDRREDWEEMTDSEIDTDIEGLDDVFLRKIVGLAPYG